MKNLRIKIKKIKRTYMFFALTILLIGVMLLLKNLGIISGDIWNIIWPSIIIIFGLSLLLKPVKKAIKEKDEIDF